MKAKFGNFEVLVKRMNNDILMYTEEDREHLNFVLADTSLSISEISNALNQNSTGIITCIYDDGTEEVFEGYRCESIRKQYDESEKTISLFFVKGEVM